MLSFVILIKDILKIIFLELPVIIPVLSSLGKKGRLKAVHR